MDKWFDSKIQEKDLRSYALRNLKKNSFSIDNFLRRFSVTNWIIIVNIIFFIAANIFFLIYGADQVIYYIGLQANSFFSGFVWTLLTSMFMHGSVSHIFVNMVSLFFIGNFVERIIGRKRLFWLYMVAGIVAGLFFVVLAKFFGIGTIGSLIFGSPETFAVGASGAIFALGGLLAILTPKLRVYVFFILPMRMWSAMIVLLGGLWLLSIFGGLPVGNTAHLGGLLVGVFYGLYLKRKYKKKTEMINRMFSN